MHLSTVQIPTNFELDWNWSSIHFLISNPDQIELFMYIIGILYWDQLVCKLGEFKELGGSEPIQRTAIGTAPWHRLFHSVNVSWWVSLEEDFWVGGCDRIGGLAYLLFCAAYWSRQLRLFRRLSRSCIDYMDLNVHCPKKAVKVNHSLTHLMMTAIQTGLNSLWSGNAIWWHRSGSTLAAVRACCLIAPSHYLNQWWLIISKVWWHSAECNFTCKAQNIYPWYEFEYN